MKENEPQTEKNNYLVEASVVDHQRISLPIRRYLAAFYRPDDKADNNSPADECKEFMKKI
jgi:hypothetical protein